MRPLAAIALLALLPAAAGAGAPSISLNGVPIDGVVSQRFENATVVIDERGNVNIVAQGYAVEGAAAAQPEGPALAPPPGPRQAAPAREERAPPPAERLSRRYFVAAQQAEASGYDVSVFLNGRWVLEVRSDGAAEPVEVTRFLQPGPNRVQLVATKRPGAAPGGPSSGARLRLAIGEGAAGAGGRVILEDPLVQMTRSAAETGTFTEEHTLVAR